ncbi:transporter, small conductance mechanosensitive ion channel MscS family protein [Leptospira fainei serovar Hurstbridge str. BUT 6]|uniref:Transporter, small conductance mechanosensitive ion channel MscS family protein n=1 Tax=Leptospira fainei serovar Hurstbridge str. BUT 6 TaxID=1193011 RepID=S3UZ85_9LEPT|nr:mechanosensitive ion channel family protein [Leptospira fainei]EPG73669.1 transporter, small conductance mechanosensitive ion channel MscS family protein [Leptospira fainei serovar Hurstbridge str. BUT 6]
MNEIDWPTILRFHWVIGPVFAALGILLGYIFGGFIVPKLARNLTKDKLDKQHPLYLALLSFVRYFFLILGLYAAIHASSLHSDAKNSYFVYLKVLAILFFTLSIANVATGFFELYSSKNEGILSSASILNNILRIGILLIGGLVILQTLGISVAPALTALGVGGLAVALGLQETLSNLFAGLEVLLGKKVRVGDFITLETGEEGHIEDISWRTTSLRKLNGSTIVIPNAKMSKTTYINYELPSPNVSIGVSLSVSYQNDLQRVENICKEVAKQTLQSIYGKRTEVEPHVRFQAFGPSSIELAVTFRLKEITDQYLLRSEFIKSLHAKFRSEGIEFPTSAQNRV